MDVLINVGYNLSYRMNYDESMIEHVFSRTDMDRTYNIEKNHPLTEIVKLSKFISPNHLRIKYLYL